MTELENKEILHSIQNERVENGIVKACLLELEKANRMIQKELKRTGGVFTKERYREIRTYLKQVAKELKNNVDSSMSVDDFVDYELQSQIKIFKKYGNVNLVTPTKEQLITTATFTPYTSTSTFANYLDSLQSDYFNLWDSTVRTGYLTGMTTQQIIKKVMGASAGNAKVADYGAIQALRNSVERNTRTALQSFAFETRQGIYNKNKDLFSGYKWIATLDRRTCVVCGSLDGKVKKEIADFGDTPPMHPNCRCTIVPVIEGYEELDQDETRASPTGQIDANITFEDWLKAQTEDVQKDVLGENRYKMFKNGEPMKSFIADNRVLTLAELKK